MTDEHEIRSMALSMARADLHTDDKSEKCDPYVVIRLAWLYAEFITFGNNLATEPVSPPS